MAQTLTQAGVGTHAAGDDQTLEAGLVQRATTLDDQGVDHGFLEGACDIGAVLLIQVIRGLGLLERDHGVGLEAGEAEVEARAVCHRAREAIAFGVALFGQLRDLRATGVGQFQHLGGLVEGFAGGVIHGLAEQLVFAQSAHRDQLGVSAGDQQRHEGEFRCIVFQHRRQQVAFHVVDAEHRHSPCLGEPMRGGRADHQCADQARACGIGDGIDVSGLQLRFVHHLLDQRQQLASVITRRQFRHHAAELGVHGDLAVEGICKQALVRVVDGDAGLVAGSLDAEHTHG